MAELVLIAVWYFHACVCVARGRLWLLSDKQSRMHEKDKRQTLHQDTPSSKEMRSQSCTACST